MKAFLLKLCVLLFLFSLGCKGYQYEPFTDMYFGGAEEGPTGGLRGGVYVLDESGFDGGIALDLSAVDGDEASQGVGTPVFFMRWRVTDNFQPYVGAGPSLVYSNGYDDSAWDPGADLRAGLTYRVGAVGEKPWWLFLEFRTLYADVRLDERGTVTSSVGGASQARGGQGKGRGRGPPGDLPPGPPSTRPPEPRPVPLPGPTPTPGPDPTVSTFGQSESLDEWNFALMLGTSIRF